MRYAASKDHVGYAQRVDEILALAQAAAEKSEHIQSRLTAELSEVSSKNALGFSELKEDLTQFKKSLSEADIVASASSLWSDKAQVHQWAFFLWLVLFVVTAGAAAVYGVTHMKEIGEALPRDKDNVIPYSSLVFIAVPVLAVAWILRIFSRFINNQQVLNDDARHRSAMTSTYLSLLADKSMSEKDRVIMLSAIFRPLPGAQTEEVAPPTILDLMRQKD